MEKTNSKSIATLTLGILSIMVPYIGLILGIIGIVISYKSLVEIDNLNEKGRGLAISGRVCSIIGICVQVFLIFLMVISLLLFISSTEVDNF